MTSNKPIRQSNIELLRILAIFMIVINHYAGYGGFKYEAWTFNAFLIQWLHIGGKLGVNIFVLISAYFLYPNSKFRWAKVIQIILEVLFYAVLIISFGWYFHLLKFEHVKWLVFAIPYYNWKFVTFYVLLYILSPFLNKAIDSFDQYVFFRLWLFLTIIWCIIPTFIPTATFGAAYDLTWYVYLYLTAALIKKTENHFSKSSSFYIFLAVLMIILVMGAEVIADYLSLKYGLLQGYEQHWREYNSLFMLISGASFFIGFKKLQIPYNKYVNRIASTTLGIFLLHDNNYRNYFWSNIIQSAKFQDSSFLILHAIGITILIIIIGAMIDLFRQWFIEKPIMNRMNLDWIDRLSCKLNQFVDKLI